MKPKVSDYVTDVQCGFKRGYLNLIDNKNTIKRMIKDKDDIKSRYLVRATAYYLYVINKILLPEYYQMGAVGVRNIIADYLVYDGASDYVILIDYEINCLLRYDVPIFYINLNSRDIMDGNGRVYKDFFPNKPVSQIFGNLDSSDGFMDKQLNIINGCMRSY